MSNDEYEKVLAMVRERLDRMIAACQQPEERRIGYGNLRHEYREWQRGEIYDTNIAIIYETPGGSTTQLNISFDHRTGEFSYLDEQLETQVRTRVPEEVLRYIQNHIQQIPQKRLEQLEKTIEMWIAQGKGRREIFAELNKLLQTEFLGGRVNTHELKHGIQYLVKEYSRAQA